MADPRFFNNAGPFTLADVLKACDATTGESSDQKLQFEDTAPLSTATSKNITFLENKKYAEEAKLTKAGACFVKDIDASLLPDTCAALIVKYPYKAAALCGRLFYPENKQPNAFSAPKNSKIDKTAIVHPSAVIGDHVTIGANTKIEANVTIAQGCQIGSNCLIEANVSVSHSIIGDHVVLYAGARIGQRGFGYTIDPVNGHMRVPQLGRVLIEDHAEIGANACVDRGAGPDTIIHTGAKIDNLVQIAHNVEIGAHSFIAGQAGIAGSTKIGMAAMIGGQAGITGHLNIGDQVFISAQSGVFRDIESKEKVMGAPVLPVREFMRREAWLRKAIWAKRGNDE